MAVPHSLLTVLLADVACDKLHDQQMWRVQGTIMWPQLCISSSSGAAAVLLHVLTVMLDA
jgi:hypothetical protein